MGWKTHAGCTWLQMALSQQLGHLAHQRLLWLLLTLQAPILPGSHRARPPPSAPVSAAPSTCHPPCPVPKHLSRELCSPAPHWGSRSPLPSHLHLSHAPGLLFLWTSYLSLELAFPKALCLPGFRNPGDAQIRSVPGSMSDDEWFLPPPLHYLLYSASQVLCSPSPSPSV